MSAILIVEDHFPTASVLKSMLERHGYEVAHVACGEAALDFLSREIPSLVILDIGLAGIDGMDVLRRVRGSERTQKIPVVVFSAFADEQLTPELLKIGANECWLKSRTDSMHILERVGVYTDRAAA